MRSFLSHKIISGLLASLLLSFGSLHAQTPSQAIVLNGEIFGSGGKATVGIFDVATQTYAVIDSIPAGSVQDVVIDGKYAYAAADSLLIKYDLDLKSRESMTTVKGIRKLAVYNNQIIAARGFGSTADHVQVFNASDLSLAYSVSAVSDLCEGVVVVGDTAYVSVPGDFYSTVGKIAVIDLDNGTWVREIDLDTLGAGIGPVFSDGNMVYTINSIAWGSAYGVVTHYDISTGAWVNNRVDIGLTKGAGLDNGLLYLILGNGIGSYDLATAQVVDTTIAAGSFVAAQVDTVNGNFYTTRTNYYSFGMLDRFNSSGNLIDSTLVGISCEALALDYRPITSITDPESRNLHLWPVPAKDRVFLSLDDIRGEVNIRIVDLQGKVVSEEVYFTSGKSLEVSIETLPAGMYILDLSSGVHHLHGRFIK